MLTRAQKEEQVASLKDKFGRAAAVYVADYRGLTVSQVDDLRSKVYADGDGEHDYRVSKNTLLRRAAEGSDVAGITEHFSGPTVVAMSFGDPVGLAKVLTEFAKEHEAFELKAGVVDGQTMTPADVGQLATLPSLDSLRGKIVGLLNAPATKLVRLISTPGEQLARLVEARRAQQEESGA